MEPANLNSPGDDMRLDALLQQRAAPLADDGFSSRVLAALPPRRSTMHHPSLVRQLVCLAGATAGLAVAATGFFLWPGFRAEPAESVANVVRNMAILVDPGVGFALAVAAFSLLYAFWPAGRKAHAR